MQVWPLQDWRGEVDFFGSIVIAQIVENRNGREKWREMEKEGSWQDNKHATLVIETLSKGMISKGGHPTPSRLPLQTAQHEEFQAKKSSSIRLIIPPVKITTKT